jgi:F420-non-reducing hydrogenase large subunit
VQDAKEWTLKTVDLAKKVVQDYWDPITKLAVTPTYYLGMHNKGNLEIYDGNLRVMDPTGKIVADFKPKDYRKYYGEYVANHSYATHVYYKPDGYPKGIWRANSLARCNVADKMATPLAQGALQEMRDALGRPIHATFAYHWARIIELVQAIEEIEGLLKDPDIVSTDVKLSDVKPKKGDGVGCVEAPRGTLIHHYWTDERGIITKANMVVATNNNIAGLEKSLLMTAKQVLEDKAHESLKLPEPMI